MENSSTCELVNTYEILEHIMGIDGLHPHSLKTVNNILNLIAKHTENQKGVILDIGCGSGKGTYNLSKKISKGIDIIGIDINKIAIQKAKSYYEDIPNLSFYHGTMEDFRLQYPTLKIIGIFSISVSMFLPDIEFFYKNSEKILSPGGIFIDAPFVFKHLSFSEKFKLKTYAICGCNMKMYTTKYLKQKLCKSNFKIVKSESKEFELMNLKILFKDYAPSYLFSNFTKNILNSPEVLQVKSSSYLFRRTIQMFTHFILNRNKYGAGILVGIKK